MENVWETSLHSFSWWKLLSFISNNTHLHRSKMLKKKKTQKTFERKILPNLINLNKPLYFFFNFSLNSWSDLLKQILLSLKIKITTKNMISIRKPRNTKLVKYLVQRSESAVVLNANTPFHSLEVNFANCKESSLLSFSSPFTQRKDRRIVNFKIKSSIHGFNFLEYHTQNCVFTLNLMRMTCANHFKRER